MIQCECRCACTYVKMNLCCAVGGMPAPSKPNVLRTAAGLTSGFVSEGGQLQTADGVLWAYISVDNHNYSDTDKHHISHRQLHVINF